MLSRVRTGRPSSGPTLKGAWEQREEEIEPNFGGAADQVVSQERPPGPLRNDAQGNVLKVPEGSKGRSRYDPPDALLARVGWLVESGIVDDDSTGLILAIERSNSRDRCGMPFNW